jgi:hypothetical protein
MQRPVRFGIENKAYQAPDDYATMVVITGTAESTESSIDNRSSTHLKFQRRPYNHPSPVPHSVYHDRVKSSDSRAAALLTRDPGLEKFHYSKKRSLQSE